MPKQRFVYSIKEGAEPILLDLGREPIAKEGMDADQVMEAIERHEAKLLNMGYRFGAYLLAHGSPSFHEGLAAAVTQYLNEADQAEEEE